MCGGHPLKPWRGNMLPCKLSRGANCHAHGGKLLPPNSLGVARDTTSQIAPKHLDLDHPSDLAKISCEMLFVPQILFQHVIQTVAGFSYSPFVFYNLGASGRSN